MSAPPKIYFFCCNDEGNLQEDVIALAEGFGELGIACYANCDYWQQSARAGDFLLRHDPEVTPDDCDVVVVSYTWPYWVRMGSFDLVRRPLPAGLFKKSRRYMTVYMDNHDGHRTVSWEPEFRQFDLILRSKLNTRAWHPDNMRPWVLGFTNRILQATQNAPAFTDRAATILINFGASHPYPHGTRELARRRFEPAIARIFHIDRSKDDLSQEPTDPHEALMWRQTGHRFSRVYYERLKHSQAVACFCGELVPPMPYRNPECYLVGGNRARLRRAFYELLGRVDPRSKRLVQWDSFRFWEALCAGSVPVHLDLRKYGSALPVMPENWKHYVGIDFDRLDDCMDHLHAVIESLGEISRDGRNWAMAHYAPVNMARRFLLELSL